MRIVHLYLARQLLLGIIVVLLALLAIDGVIDFLDEIDRVDADYPLNTMLFYSLLEIIVSAYELFPIAVLLGCVVGLGNLAVHLEFVALRTCGYTRLHITYVMLAVGVLLMVATGIYGEFIVSKAQYQQYQIKHCCKQYPYFFASDMGYWVREGDHFINFKALSDDDVYTHVNVFEVDSDYRLLRHIKAEQASELSDQKILMLQDAEIVTFATENRIDKKDAAQVRIPFTISELAHTIPESFKQQHMNIYQLYSYIQFLERNELNTEVYELALWTRFSTVLSIPIVILLAAPWLLATLQSTAMGKRFFIAVLLGLSYIIVSRIFGNLSIGYHFPTWLGAFSPALLFSLLGVYLFRTRKF